MARVSAGNPRLMRAAVKLSQGSVRANDGSGSGGGVQRRLVAQSCKALALAVAVTAAAEAQGSEAQGTAEAGRGNERCEN